MRLNKLVYLPLVHEAVGICFISRPRRECGTTKTAAPEDSGQGTGRRAIDRLAMYNVHTCCTCCTCCACCKGAGNTEYSVHTEHNLSACQTWVESTPQSGLCVFWPVFFFSAPFFKPYRTSCTRVSVSRADCSPTRGWKRSALGHIMYMYIHCRGRGA